MNEMIVSITTIGGLGLICSILLVITSKLMYVKVDDRIVSVREALPGANCGACGCAGCDDFAKEIVENNADPSRCIPGGQTCAEEISNIMGLSKTRTLEKVVALKCNGKHGNTSKKYDYNGIKTCLAVSGLFSGDGQCAYGCIGLGDCIKMCPFNAMEIKDGIVNIIKDKCVGCGVCVDVCPKNLLYVIEDKKKAVVQCRNMEKGAITRKNCTVGCIGCKKCANICPVNAISVEDNLAFIDSEICVGCEKCVGVCPTSAISMKGI